jgi:ribonuclease PH
VTITPFPTGADGSVINAPGGTRVLCTASVAAEVPPWLVDRETGAATSGWLTAEYAMLPGSTAPRKRRGADGRATEIQRMIGRALRAAVDLERMKGMTVTCDCDVMSADGGTRTASITGAFVALALALRAARQQDLIVEDPLRGPVAAVSAGIVDGRPILDLDYELDSAADVDMNVAMNHRGELIEVQATGERAPLGRAQFEALLDLAAKGIRSLMVIQRRAITAAGSEPARR